MQEEETGTALLEPPAPPQPPGAVATADEEPPRRPWWSRLLVVLAYTIGVLAVIFALAYNFGSMWFPSRETRAQYDQLVAAGQANPPTEQQFHIPIPGCVCHSKNPATVMAHQDRRIRQCMGCHGG